MKYIYGKSWNCIQAFTIKALNAFITQIHLYMVTNGSSIVELRLHVHVILLRVRLHVYCGSKTTKCVILFIFSGISN